MVRQLPLPLGAPAVSRAFTSRARVGGGPSAVAAPPADGVLRRFREDGVPLIHVPEHEVEVPVEGRKKARANAPDAVLVPRHDENLGFLAQRTREKAQRPIELFGPEQQIECHAGIVPVVSGKPASGGGSRRGCSASGALDGFVVTPA